MTTNIHSTVKTTSSLLISRHIAPDGTEIVWKGLNLVRNKPGHARGTEDAKKNSKLNGLEIIWEDIQIIKRGKHINPAAAANVQPISYYAPVLSYNKATTPHGAVNPTSATATASGIPSTVPLSKIPESEIASNVDLQLSLLLNPQAAEDPNDGAKSGQDAKGAGDKSQQTPNSSDKKDSNNNQVQENKNVVTKTGTLTTVKGGVASAVEKMDTTTNSQTLTKVETKPGTVSVVSSNSSKLPPTSSAPPGKDAPTSASASVAQANQHSNAQAAPGSNLNSTDLKDDKSDIKLEDIKTETNPIGADGSISSDLATELKAWRVRAENAEKRVQKVELQLVNMKRRAETAEVRSGTKPTDAPEGETLSAVEKMKASVDKNATPEQKAEAATKWATDAMVNQADAEKKAKAAEERAITAQKQATVAMNDTKLAEMRADNAERKNLEFEEKIEKFKKESENMRNRALAAESRAEAMLAAMQKRAGRSVDTDRDGSKNQTSDRPKGILKRRSEEERFEIIEIDSIKDRMKGKPKGRMDDREWSSAQEFIKPPGRNMNAKYKCSHCDFTSTRKTDYEKHVKRCVLEIAARSSIRKPSKPDSMTDSSISGNRVRRKAATNALDNIVEGDQSWQGLMLDNKGIRPGVPVPVLDGEESASGFNEDDEETFLAAECQELFGDILDDDANNSNSNADLQLAEEILNDWEKEDLTSNKHKDKSKIKSDSTENKASEKASNIKKRSSMDSEDDATALKKEKYDDDAPLSKPKTKKVTKEDDFGPAIPLF